GVTDEDDRSLSLPGVFVAALRAAGRRRASGRGSLPRRGPRAAGGGPRAGLVPGARAGRGRRAGPGRARGHAAPAAALTGGYGELCKRGSGCK
ncbi:unnamed protein product, partial [Leptidea sinapis]